MRLIPSDPDIATLLARIKAKDLDLQPDFQRGEVWSTSKKQKLVDSILRNWYVPPVHVVENVDSGLQEVLDGQQRLAAIRDFAAGKIKVDGEIEPFDSEIASLNKKAFSDLPDAFRRRFEQFTIRVMKVVDYQSTEPAELFFRLNQPVGLTTAEQRNAFFGETRHQIRQLVLEMEGAGIGKDLVGFSNSRMAYDDIIARVAMTLDGKTLNQRIDAASLANKYRADNPFSLETVERIRLASQVFSKLRGSYENGLRFNKATLYSWFIFIVRANEELEGGLDGEVFGAFLLQFNNVRLGFTSVDARFSRLVPLIDKLISIYEDRSTSRVGDAASIVYRDVIAWVLYIVLAFRPKRTFISGGRVERLYEAIVSAKEPEGSGLIPTLKWLQEIIDHSGWGAV
jgi:hypothetical protein